MSNNPQLKILHEKDLEDKICIVVGTRPGMIMFSPIIREIERRNLDFFVLHTGQHYSYNMDKKFFEDLNLKGPKYKLDTVKYCKLHGEQTAEMMKGVEEVLLKEKSKIVLVGGDANTNLAGALAARKLHIKVGHVEAGERSFDWRMPEEHNRVIIDHISEYLFTTNEKGKKHLERDNVQGKIFVTGNPIVDAAYQNREIANEKSEILDELDLKKRQYGVLTTHREENVDNKERLMGILGGIERAVQEIQKPIVFMAHPRTLKRIKEFNLEKKMSGMEDLIVSEAVGYLDFLQLLSNSAIILTDSGGVQQEACIFKIPCVTLRENTEWTETLEIGANVLAGVEPDKIATFSKRMINKKRNWEIPFGDGHASERIVNICEEVIR